MLNFNEGKVCDAIVRRLERGALNVASPKNLRTGLTRLDGTAKLPLQRGSGDVLGLGSWRSA
jgi:hypothetical protein